MSEAAKAQRQGVEIFPHPDAGKTRDKVAAAVGLGSGRTYDKAGASASLACVGSTTGIDLVAGYCLPSAPVTVAGAKFLTPSARRSLRMVGSVTPSTLAMRRKLHPCARSFATTSRRCSRVRCRRCRCRISDTSSCTVDLGTFNRCTKLYTCPGVAFATSARSCVV